MSSSLSIKVFGAYLLPVGLMLIFAPNVLLGLFGIPPASEVWVRVLGIVVTGLSYTYWRMGAAGAREYFAVSVQVRMFVGAALAALVAFGYAPLPLLLFALVDVAGAAWTFLALRGERATA
jgi:hypothetical protein